MDEQVLEFPVFLRKYEQRASGIMWLLGAGASRASGIKTAGDMIWDFKARIFRSAKSISASAVADLGDDRVRQALQKYFDDAAAYPKFSSEEEYAHFFEETYPDPKDRRRYIDAAMRGAKPSYGHLALAHLLKKDLARVIWTTNFDRLVEDAVAKVWETSSILTAGDLGEPKKVARAFAEQQWPIYGKIHGDFHSEALKNTSEELSSQDAEMRRVLLDTCRNQGLLVSGYSGRDASVMSVLEEALNDGAGFPNGLFWFVREQDTPYPGVVELVRSARHLGIDANFVQAGSFDELLSDILRYLPQTERLSIDLGDKQKIKPRAIDLSDRSKSIPFVRTNAIPVLEYPRTARLVDCEIGGVKDVREKIENAQSDLIATRIRKGVIAFGDDGELKRVFSENNIQSLDTHGILDDRLAFESGERGLIRDALFRAIANYCGLKPQHRGSRTFFRSDHGSFNFDNSDLQRVTGRLNGVLRGGDIVWSEACELRLDFKLGQLWLLLDPVVLIDTDDATEPDDLQAARDFIRERRVKRYNKQFNDLLDAWVGALFGSSSEILSFGIEGGTGIGARFEIIPVTGFSGAMA